MDLPGKVAIVTGAGSGIGRATALRLAREGARVVAADLDEAAGPETVRLIDAAQGEARFRRVDVSSEADVTALIAYAEEVFGGLDILHNNAGVLTTLGGFEATSSARWLRTLDVNLRGVLLGTYHALPALRRRGGGVIVQTASVAGLDPLTMDPVYAATKAGVVNFTRSLRYLQKEANIRVNCVCPGGVATNILPHALETMSPAEREAYQKGAARSGIRAEPLMALQPEEVAEAVLRLIVDETLTGRAYRVEANRTWELL